MVNLYLLAVPLLASAFIFVEGHNSAPITHARFSRGQNRLDKRQDTLANRVRVAAINLDISSATSSGDRSAISNKINRPNASVPNTGNTTSCAIASGLDDSVIERIKKNLAETATDSWVAGTQAEALLELNAPSSSVFSPFYNVSGASTGDLAAIIDVANIWLAKLGPDAQQLVEISGGAAGDAASLGSAFFTASKAESGNDAYRKYLDRQKDYLLNQLPRDSETGAISHRPNNEPFQAWSDWGYMVPPFLSQYAVLHDDILLARETYNQIKGYRSILRDSETELWRHVKRGNWEDDKLWSTGIGWTLAGIVRTYATLHHSQFRSEMQSELSDMAGWANQIIAAVLQRVNVSIDTLAHLC